MQENQTWFEQWEVSRFVKGIPEPTIKGMSGVLLHTLSAAEASRLGYLFVLVSGVTPDVMSPVSF